MRMRICFIGLAVIAALSFSGCTTPRKSAQNSSGQLDVYFPKPPTGLPFDPFRTNLYTAAELLKGYDTNAPESYYSTPDWQSYLFYKRAKQSKDAGNPDEIALRYTRLHDLSIEEALDKWLSDTNQSGPKKVVGIMGGHEMERKVYDPPGSTNYSDYMNVVLLARELTLNHFTILSAGGPGVMEAANLGAWMAGYPESKIVEAVTTLATVPASTNSALWLRPAVMVKMRYSDPNGNSNSIGVPTWFYGFEPPNPFATHIAKYFENSLREDHLLAISKNGIVFAHGSAGTVQEIFQSACQNYYKTSNRCPMILLGANYWNRGASGDVDPRDKPAWPLLQQLGKETNFVQQLFISDDIHAIAEFIRTNSVNHTKP